MGLQFYYGSSGAGKSRLLCETVVKRSVAEPDTEFLIIVPDQFTMQTQKDYVLAHERHGIMNIDVLSFSRLSHRILEETGGGAEPVLDDTGKSLVLRKIAADCADRLQVIGKNLHKQGYIHEVKSAISEFMQYGIGAEELSRLIDFAEQRNALRYKLEDLSVLYGAFTEYIRERFITTEETLDRLCRRLPESELVKRSVIVFDGFTGFTPIQNRVILQLMKLAEDVIVTAIIDSREDPFCQDGEQKLFHLSKKTVCKLREAALENNIPVKKEVALQGNPVPRFLENPEMAHLEQNLFRYPSIPYEGGAEALRIFEAGSPREEIRQVCVFIRRLIRQGMAYRDMAVVMGDLAAYAPHVETEFPKYGIPFYLDRTRAIVLNPFIEFIRSALGIVLKNFSYESVFHYLRSGLAGVESMDADLLENYVLASGVKGKRAWTRLFTRQPKGFEKEELQQVNETREKLVGRLAPLMGKMKTAEEMGKALYEFIVNNEIQIRLARYENLFLEKGDLAKAKEYGQIYRLVMDLLDQIIALLSDETMTLQEFADILDAGFGEIQVGTIPQNVDRVLAGDIERTRLNQIKVLFFVGINDGNIPKVAGAGGIISDIDREFLRESQFELAPSPRQQMYIQRLYLYMNMTKPTKQLYLSYSKISGDGKSLRPAYLIDMVRRLFPGIPIENPQLQPLEEQLETGRGSMDELAVLLRRYAAGELEETEEARFYTLFYAYYKDACMAGSAEMMTEAAFREYRAKPLGRLVARALYGQYLQNSVSRLETYASCAYAHFLQYGLLLREREHFTFEAADLGNILHGVLELFAQKLEENGKTWFDFSVEEGRVYLEASLEEYAAAYGGEALFDNARNQYMVRRMKRILLRTIFSLQAQLKKGLFSPAKFEMSFSMMEDLDSVNIALSGEERMKLRGRIDRVDTFEDEEHVYVKVIDYKSGSRQFDLVALYYGLQLQLVVYLNAALEQEKKEHPDKEIVPAAVLYYHVADPMITPEGELTPEEINERLLRELRMNGVVADEGHVVDLLDRTFETKSDVIPVERKKDGAFSARSSVMSRDELRKVSGFVSSKIRQIGREILQGNIELNPYERGNQDACTFCAYRAVCGFDPRIPGLEKRRLDEMSREEAMEKIIEWEDGTWE